MKCIAAAAAYADSITVTNGWMRALPPPTPSAGYFTLINDSGRHIVLTGASSPACGMLMLHKTSKSNGMASMTDLENVPVAVGATIHFEPGGYHLMCMDPTAAVTPGNKIQVTLVFADGTKIVSEFAVRDATGR